MDDHGLEQPGHALHGLRLLRVRHPAALQHDPGPGGGRIRQPGDERRGHHRHLPGDRRPDGLDQHDLRRQEQLLDLRGVAVRRSPAPAARRRAHRARDARDDEPAAADDVRPGQQLVHRRRDPDHAVRRRRPQEHLPDDAPGRQGLRRQRARHHRHRAAGLGRDGLQGLPRLQQRRRGAPERGLGERPEPGPRLPAQHPAPARRQAAGSRATRPRCRRRGTPAAGFTIPRRPAASRSCAPPATAPTPSPAPARPGSRRSPRRSTPTTPRSWTRSRT